MQAESIRNYVARLPIPPLQFQAAEAVPPVQAIDIDHLPEGIVTGSTLIQFPPEANAQLRSSIALSLLAAQRVAANDNVIVTPEQWIQRHNTVLTNLNWLNEGGGTVEAEFDDIDAAVHEAIIPFLAAAFGGVVGAGALIITALKQLKEMDRNSSWITLFDNQSRRFNITEYQFSIVQVQGSQVHLKMASARFDASFGKTQVIFVKVNRQHAKFESISQAFSADADILTDLNQALKERLATNTQQFIRSIPDELLKPERLVA